MIWLCQENAKDVADDLHSATSSNGCRWQQARPQTKKRVSVTLSAFFLSVLSGNTPHAQAANRGSDVMDLSRTPSSTPDDEELRRCKLYRKSFPATEIALPATALRNRAIAKWVRDRRVTIDVHSGEELATALAAGVRLQRLTVYADALSESELTGSRQSGSWSCRRRIGPAGRTAAIRCREARAGCRHPHDRRQHAGLAVAGVADRVPVGFLFDSNESDTAIAAVLDHEWLNLVGLALRGRVARPRLRQLPGGDRSHDRRDDAYSTKSPRGAHPAWLGRWSCRALG